MAISSVGILANQLQKVGGLREYRDNLWTRMAFAARYGNQSLDLLLRYRSDDIEHFNEAINDLLKAENQK